MSKTEHTGGRVLLALGVLLAARSALTPWGSIVATLRVSPVSSSSSASRPPARSQRVRNPPGASGRPTR